MYLKKLQIKNFKSFQDISIEFNKDINILTGVNNAGKTTMLEAIALWHECFSKFITQAKRSTPHYNSGDFVLGNTQNKFFPYYLNSISVPNFEDIFYQQEKKNKIELRAIFENNEKEKQVLNIDFRIGLSGWNYTIDADIPYSPLAEYYKKFNDFFKNFPNPIGFYYASPVAAIESKEKFVTTPQIKEAILNRQSAKVFRNRLYQLYVYNNGILFSEFIGRLSFILYDNQQQISISSNSNPNQDTEVVFNFKISSRDTEKEISLLGSGTLQIIEILLNLYSPDDARKDVKFILLDEPDSHIHRAIQERLLIVLKQFTKNTQLFLSTHNEALIRSASLEHLFHLEPKSKSESSYKSLVHQNLEKQSPYFKGMYPALTNPVISSLGRCDGLDFLNAIESDHVIFVEGQDDAQALDILFKKGAKIGEFNKKCAYWVLNGVDNILKEILHYKSVFSLIKNEKTLWQKSVLFFDRDYLYDELLSQFCERLNGKGMIKDKDVKWDAVKIPAYAWKSYTFESIVFSDLEKLSKLLSQWLFTEKSISEKAESIKTKLQTSYLSIKPQLENKFDEKFYQFQAGKQKSIIDKINDICGKENMIKIDRDYQLNPNIREHIKKCLDNKEYYKLMDKNDVAFVINDCVSSFSTFYDKEDFISLIQCVDRGTTWFNDWNVLTEDLR